MEPLLRKPLEGGHLRWVEEVDHRPSAYRREVQYVPATYQFVPDPFQSESDEDMD